MHSPSEDEDLKPDILEGERSPLSPAEAMRRELETYGEDSTFPNREDQEDEHAGAS
ncbi:MAG TPA: hypothetical protein VMF61_11555 [Candidatus Acidoferrales bacterium]|nr:hypothetical protein [Candidatus Acidoferrales bacterium]